MRKTGVGVEEVPAEALVVPSAAYGADVPEDSSNYLLWAYPH